MTTLIQRASELAYSDTPHDIDRLQRVANMVNNKIAIENKNWLQGEVQTHVAVAILHNCSYTQEYLIEEMGERVANAVIAIQEGCARTDKVAAYVQKVIGQHEYLAAVAMGDFERANNEWRKVEACL